MNARAADPDRKRLTVASQRGHATKVMPGPNAIPVPGWYAYLTRPGAAGDLIRHGCPSGWQHGGLSMAGRPVLDSRTGEPPKQHLKVSHGRQPAKSHRPESLTARSLPTASHGDLLVSVEQIGD